MFAVFRAEGSRQRGGSASTRSAILILFENMPRAAFGLPPALVDAPRAIFYLRAKVINRQALIADSKGAAQRGVQQEVAARAFNAAMCVVWVNQTQCKICSQRKRSYAPARGRQKICAAQRGGRWSCVVQDKPVSYNARTYAHHQTSLQVWGGCKGGVVGTSRKCQNGMAKEPVQQREGRRRMRGA